MQSREWTAVPEEKLKIPEEYYRDQNYEILILSAKKTFSQITCTDYELEGDVCKLHRVFIDTSEKNSRGKVTLQRVSYHEEVDLVNVGFMAIPLPRDSASEI